MRICRVGRTPFAADDEHRDLSFALSQRRLPRREMVAERRDGMHELGIMHPHAIGSRQTAAWPINHRAIAILLFRRHLLHRVFGVAAESGGIRHRVSSSSGLKSDVLRDVNGEVFHCFFKYFEAALLCKHSLYTTTVCCAYFLFISEVRHA